MILTASTDLWVFFYFLLFFLGHAAGLAAVHDIHTLILDLLLVAVGAVALLKAILLLRPLEIFAMAVAGIALPAG